MKKSILYYPTINIEDSLWLRNAILYWDEICSIVPNDYNHDVSAEIRYLMELEYYRPLNPLSIFESEISMDFENEILVRIKAMWRNLKSTKKRNHGEIHIEKLVHPDIYESLHYNKINHRIFEFLMKERIIQENNDKAWYYMESNILQLYMSILAKYLAKIDKNYMVVSTDKATKQYYAYNRTHPKYGDLCLVNLIEKVLPTPYLDTPLEDVINFKEKRREELIKFREELSSFEDKLSRCNQIEEIKKIMVEFKESIEIELKDMEKMLKDAKIEFSLTSFKSIINLKQPDILLTALTAGTIMGKVPLWLTATGIGMNGAINIGVNCFNLRKKQSEIIDKSGLAYLYYANQDRILRWH